MGWVERATRRTEAKLQALANSAPTIHGEFSTDPTNAPGWREVGMEFTCIPDALHPWDENAVRLVREIDPSFVPVTIRWVFLSPQNTGNPQPEVFIRYGLARKVDDPHSELPPMNVLMPTSGNLPRPNKLEKIFQGERKKERYCDLPGAFQPFDMQVYSYIRDNYGHQDMEDVRGLLRKMQEDRQRKKEKIQEEWEYISRDVEKYAQKMLDRVSEIEVRDRLLGDSSKGTTPYVFMR